MIKRFKEKTLGDFLKSLMAAMLGCGCQMLSRDMLYAGGNFGQLDFLVEMGFGCVEPYIRLYLSRTDDQESVKKLVDVISNILDCRPRNDGVIVFAEYKGNCKKHKDQIMGFFYWIENPNGVLKDLGLEKIFPDYCQME